MYRYYRFPTSQPASSVLLEQYRLALRREDLDKGAYGQTFRGQRFFEEMVRGTFHSRIRVMSLFHGGSRLVEIDKAFLSFRAQPFIFVTTYISNRKKASFTRLFVEVVIAPEQLSHIASVTSLLAQRRCAPQINYMYLDKSQVGP